MPPRPTPPTTTALDATFATLRTVLRARAPKALVVVDTASRYEIASPTLTDRVGRPLFLASVERRARYVSFHFIPLYALPELARSLSAELARRLTGKSCFNFTTLEPVTRREVESLVKVGVPKMEQLTLPWITRLKDAATTSRRARRPATQSQRPATSGRKPTPRPK